MMYNLANLWPCKKGGMTPVVSVFFERPFQNAIVLGKKVFAGLRNG